MESQAVVFEKLGAVIQTAQAAHTRLDRLENEIKSDLVGISADVKALRDHMNQSKGWKSGVIWIVGIIGAGLGILLKTFIK